MYKKSHAEKDALMAVILTYLFLNVSVCVHAHESVHRCALDIYVCECIWGMLASRLKGHTLSKKWCECYEYILPHLEILSIIICCVKIIFFFIVFLVFVTVTSSLGVLLIKLV